MEKLSQEKTVANQFDKMAPHYEEGPWGIYFRYCYKKIREISEPYIRPESKILDLGCGTGGLVASLSPLIEKYGEIIGVDISPKMIEVAIKNNKHYNKDKNIRFVVSGAEKLPFQDSYFNLVFCLNSFHHYFNQRDAINEICRIMAPDSFFILLDAFSDNPIRKLWGLVLKFLFNEPYAKYHTKSSLNDLFNKSNMQLLKQERFFYFALISIYKKNN